MSRRFISFVLVTLVGLAMLALREGDTPEANAVTFTETELKRIFQHSLAAPPANPTNRVADDANAARFGQALFFETRFSATGKISCATCHNPELDFTDGKPLGEAIGRMNRHTMSLWNVAYNRWFFWDGRADSLWAQALDPIENPNEHGGNRLKVAHVLFNDVEFRRAYELIFGAMPNLADHERFPPEGRPIPEAPHHALHVAWNGMSAADQQAVNQVFANVGKAIEAYERLLISNRSAFDVFVDGLKSNDAAQQRALSPAAQRGLRLFLDRANCRLCHAGPNFTDGEFHNTGVPPREGAAPDPARFDGAKRVLDNPFNSQGAFSDDPAGDSNNIKFLLHSPELWGQFKTPSLRNIAKTAPYMHQGQFQTLHEVVRFYSTRQGAVRIGHHQETILNPLNLSEAEIDDLVAFLESLTGEPLPATLLTAPDHLDIGDRVP
ncbi:MAG: c-type cytochrome [Phycisphaerales bacterium]|nr:c-type cytochrome [Phycisphaerales bacterium]